ncbi:hypothetical protein P3T76_011732 [Phytophthora citrophthora]|uniref:SWIM-type domain-containing protein n=1 Tax=Phytophthora citrophthora TaxID=4793 RepID=A0AAD9G8V1_9STRA|nr:hypothetical protein P3T76_011732 [Phytophthora citrophthora]
MILMNRREEAIAAGSDNDGDMETHNATVSEGEGGDSVESGVDSAAPSDAETAENTGNYGVDDAVLVSVEPPSVWHQDWETWETYHREYCSVPVRETMSRAERNKRKKKTKKGEDESQRYPKQWTRTNVRTSARMVGSRESPGAGERGRNSIYASLDVLFASWCSGIYHMENCKLRMATSNITTAFPLPCMARIQVLVALTLPWLEHKPEECSLVVLNGPRFMTTYSSTTRCTDMFIVVDKDLNEIRVLESNFPEARILICHFHVIKYLKEMRAKPEFGKILSDAASQLDAAIHRMVYACSEDDYKVSHESLEGLCARIGLQEFSRISKGTGILAKIDGEFFFGKLKGSVDSSKRMVECIKALIASDKRVQNEYQYRLSRIGQFVNSNYENGNFSQVYYAFLETQNARALEKCNSYCFTEDPDGDCVVLVGGKFSEHKLRLDNWQCDCEFAMSMKLPCRHAIAHRKKKQVGGTLIIHERWTSCSRDLKKVKQFSYERFESSTMGTRSHDMRSHHERYREAVRATHLIANEMADIEDEAEFSEMLIFVLNQWRNIRQKKRTSHGSSSETKASVGVAMSKEKRERERVKHEFGLSSSSDEDMTSAFESAENEEEEHPFESQGPKGWQTAKGEEEDRGWYRKWYEAAEPARKTAGEVTLKSLTDNLDREKPSFLSGILVKYSEADKKKPKFKRMKNPVLILDPLMDACLAAFPSANTEEIAIAMTVPDAPIGPPVDMSQQMADETDKLAVIHISHPAPEIWDMIREEFTAPGKITRGLSREQVISRVYRARHNHFGGSIYSHVEVPPLSLARDGSNFFQFNFTFPGETGPDRLIGWGHPALVRLLMYDNVSLFLDATFRCVPASFYQCIVVMVYDRGSRCYVPCVTILSTTKTEWSWWHALHGVQVCTKMSMQPGTITCDYERAVLNAARDQFPEPTTVGCLFHFKQAVRRRMQKLYIPTEEISVVMRRHMLDILTVLPHDQIDPQGIEHVVALIKEALAEKESTYSEAKWTQFWDYFRRTWILIVNRTNNPLERYNRELNGSFSTPRPNLANFVGVIEKHSHYYVTLLEDIARGRARAPVHGDYFDVGSLSRLQIEIFKRVHNFKTCVQLGMDVLKWLTVDGILSLPVEYHECGAQVADDLMKTYPHNRIAGIPDQPDFDYARLYRAIPPTWLNQPD